MDGYRHKCRARFITPLGGKALRPGLELILLEPKSNQKTIFCHSERSEESLSL
jgi:hypothetical protein